MYAKNMQFEYTEAGFSQIWNAANKNWERY